MKKVTRLFAAAVTAVTIGAATVCANVYTFTPSNSKDLNDLDHYDYFTWGIQFELPSNEKIVEATLTFDNIWDWTKENNDRLYVHLLDNTKLNANSYYDAGGNGDNFKNQGKLIGVWTDSKGGRARNFDLVYKFSTLSLLDTLNTYLKNDSIFGFGIDPDCHYYNDGVTFKIETRKEVQPVPEPASLMLLGMGLLGAAGVSRKKLFNRK